MEIKVLNDGFMGKHSKYEWFFGTDNKKNKPWNKSTDGETRKKIMQNLNSQAFVAGGLHAVI